MNLSDHDQEHVTLKFRDNSAGFNLGNLESDVDLSHHRWTVDYAQDFLFVESIFNFFKGNETTISVNEILDAIKQFPHLNIGLSGNLRNINLENGWR
jgi:spore coat polysaccharide biosynthesis protein SpsF (cytidylyltransferase family)